MWKNPFITSAPIKLTPFAKSCITEYRGKKYCTTPENISRLLEKYTELCLANSYSASVVQIAVEDTLEPLLAPEQPNDNQDKK